jgi:hypothetical protein
MSPTSLLQWCRSQSSVFVGLNQFVPQLRRKCTRSGDHGTPGFPKLLECAYPIILTNAAYDMRELTLGRAVTSIEYLAILNPLNVRYAAQRHNNIEEEQRKLFRLKLLFCECSRIIYRLTKNKSIGR